MLRMCVAVALLLALGGRSVCADDPVKGRLDVVRSSKTLRVGTTGDYRPFSFLNPETKDFEGIDIEMARVFAKALGVQVVFVQTSWPTLMSDFKADMFDLAVGGISISPERQKLAFFSVPYLRDGKTAIARCVDQAKYQSLLEIDRPEVRVVANPGGTNEKFDRANLKYAVIQIYPDNKTIWRQISDGNADIMITDGSEARLWAKEHKDLCAIHPDKMFNSFEKAYLLPRDPEWKVYVDQWLHGEIKNKAYQAIAGRWGQ